jgi:hypothetical protein
MKWQEETKAECQVNTEDEGEKDSEGEMCHFSLYLSMKLFWS